MNSLETLDFDLPDKEKPLDIGTLRRRLTTVLGVVGFGLSVHGVMRQLPDIHDRLGSNQETQSVIDHYGDRAQRIIDLYGNNLLASLTQNSPKVGVEVRNEKWITGEGTWDNAPLPLDSVSSLKTSEGEINEPMLLVRLLGRYPRSWLENIASIRQKDEEASPTEEYGLEEGWKTVGSARRNTSGKTEITLYRPTLRNNILENRGTLFHEVAHANDWERAREMTVEERINLLIDITERIDAPDRYQSQYVEAIRNPNKQQEKYLKAVEYWAEINQVYLNNPSVLSVKDFKIIESRLHGTHN